jgi:hypothetical protein
VSIPVRAKKILCSFSVGLLLTGVVFAAELPGDTIRFTSSEEKEAVPEIVHSPRKAAIYSAILPGMGQAYNRKYWKIPLIYSGFGAFGYFIGWNNKNFNISRRAYSDLTDNDPETVSYMRLKQIIYYNLDNPSSVANLKQGLLSSQDYYRRNRDLLIIITAAFYGLNIIDASVDAHFFNFNLNDDLTLNVKPIVHQEKQQPIFCLNCTFNF